ncbi:hypothetical protein GIB67_034498, partial [Kingdonia uniflora]
FTGWSKVKCKSSEGRPPNLYLVSRLSYLKKYRKLSHQVWVMLHDYCQDILEQVWALDMSVLIRVWAPNMSDVIVACPVILRPCATMVEVFLLRCVESALEASSRRLQVEGYKYKASSRSFE